MGHCMTSPLNQDIVGYFTETETNSILKFKAALV